MKNIFRYLLLASALLASSIANSAEDSGITENLNTTGVLNAVEITISSDGTGIDPKAHRKLS